MVKKDPKGIWQEYMQGLTYNDSIGLGETVKRNELFVRGRQWEGVYAPDIDKPVFNILKRVKNYLIAMLVSDDIGVSLSLFNRVENSDARIKLTAVEEQIDQIMEYTHFRPKMRDVLDDAAVDGDGCMHVYFDPDKETGWQGVTGQIEAEVLDNTYVFFGNTEEADPQKQPYIIIEQRRLLQDVKDEMKKNGRPQDDIDSVTLSTSMNQQFREEEQTNSSKVTVLIKYWKENGTIHFCKVTEGTYVKEETDTGLKLYPIAWMSWEKVKHCYHGESAITGLIPNQIAINKMAAMAQRFIRQQAFPRVIYDSSRLKAWKEGVAPIAVNGNPKDIVAYDNHATAMSAQVGQYIDTFINLTRDLMGASDAALGQVRADNTSAIIAVQKATGVPLELVRQEYYKFVEDFVRILTDQMRVYYGQRMVVTRDELEQAQEIPLDFGFLNEWQLQQNVDIGTAAYWSELTTVQSLDALFSKQLVDPIDYLEAVPKHLIPGKSKLIERYKERQQQMEQIQAAAQSAQPMSAGAMAANEITAQIGA